MSSSDRLRRGPQDVRWDIQVPLAPRAVYAQKAHEYRHHFDDHELSRTGGRCFSVERCASPSTRGPLSCRAPPSAETLVPHSVAMRMGRIGKPRRRSSVAVSLSICPVK